MPKKICYYELLNLERSANESDIKKAYKKLAVKWHPDKNPQDPEGSAEMFKLIAEAYDILSNPESRQMYDLYGHDGPGISEDGYDDNQQFRRGSERSGGRTRSTFGSHSHFSNERAFDIFNQFFAQFDRDMHGLGFGGGASSLFADPFFDSDPFFSGHQSRSGHHHSNSSYNGTTSHRTHESTSRRNDPFSDPFFSGYGGLMGGHFMDMMSDDNGRRGNNNGGSRHMSSFTSMSSVSSSGRGHHMSGTTTSTRTTIGADGIKRVHKEVTVHHPDGRTETSVEEFVDDSQHHRITGNSGNRDGVRRIPISGGEYNGRNGVGRNQAAMSATSGVLSNGRSGSRRSAGTGGRERVSRRRVEEEWC